MRNVLEETKYILNKYKISANKKLGQNFLIDYNVIKQIVSESDIQKDDLVIEIGPGLGTLTAELLDHAGKVIAIELDERMIKILNDRFKLYNNFNLLHEDVLKLNQNELISRKKESKKKKKIVANLPYYITTPIIMKLLEDKLNITSITVMVQKEVADRITARPGDKLSGAITYSVDYYADAKNLMFVDKTSFLPSPEVDSEVIGLNIRKEPKVQVLDEKLFFKVIKSSFMQRRKTLLNGLTNTGIITDKNIAKEIIEKMGLPLDVRGEKLTIEQYAELANLIRGKIST